MEKEQKTQLFLGIILGILAPVITFLIIYLTKFDHLNIGEFINTILHLNIAGKFVSLATISNLLVFFVFIWLNKLSGARGVIGSTIIIALFVLIIKFVF